MGEVVLKKSAFVIPSVGSLNLLTLSNHEIRIRLFSDFLAKKNLLAPVEKPFPAIQHLLRHYTELFRPAVKRMSQPRTSGSISRFTSTGE